MLHQDNCLNRNNNILIAHMVKYVALTGNLNTRLCRYNYKEKQGTSDVLNVLIIK